MNTNASTYTSQLKKQNKSKDKSSGISTIAKVVNIAKPTTKTKLNVKKSLQSNDIRGKNKTPIINNIINAGARKKFIPELLAKKIVDNVFNNKLY